ncbi:MAG: NlpC/P60 family protein [Fimbriimonadaceae bacterium]
MSFKAGLSATGIALCALGGAAPVATRPAEGLSLLNLDQPLYASLDPHAVQSHKVVKNENDWTISRKYGITVQELHAANPGVDWRKLQIGQKLNLPGGAEDTTSIPKIETEKVKVKTNGVNVRKEPSTNSGVRTTVDKGTVATVLDRQGAWYELRFPKGTVGWIRGDLLSAVNATSDSSEPKPAAAVAPVNASKASSIIDAAMDMLGVRYKWGGNSRGGIDCSGLTTLVFSKNGIQLPRTSIEQSKIGSRVDKEDLQAGDLLFFVTGRSSSRINHVGLYIGEGKFVHASSYKGRVIVTSLNDYRSGYAGARRVPGLQIAEVEKAVVAPVAEKVETKTAEELFPSRVVIGADKTGK